MVGCIGLCFQKKILVGGVVEQLCPVNYLPPLDNQDCDIIIL